LIIVVALGACNVLPGKKKSGSAISLGSIGALSDVPSGDDATAADTLDKPSLDPVPDFLADAKDQVKSDKKKKKKKYKVFLGHKVKRGYARSGGKGKNQTIETFYFLRVYQDPDPFVPEKYYFDLKTRKLRGTKGTVDPGRAKILHGPYKKTVGGKIIEEGYFYLGNKHLRWEKFNKEFILISKIHFEKGHPRDATVHYHDAELQKVKEVIPQYNGEVQGRYLRFYEDGQLEWEGQYEKGRKVGIWTNYYNFRQRRHYQYQYPESPYDAPADPVLFREYDRSGNIVYEKGKLDKRAQR
jgi:antitoxin component YwqK of YwqJK toxin-antitoxin module